MPTENPMSLWILIAGTLVGTLLGGVLGLLNTRLQFKTQFGRERERLILGKLEELHQVLSQFKQAYAELSLMAGTNAAVEALIKQHASIPTEKLKMLVGFYAPELSPQVEAVVRLSRGYDEALARFIRWEEKDEQTRNDILSAAADLMRKLDAACSEMQAGVIKLSGKHI